MTPDPRGPAAPRLAALEALGVLDTPPEERFDRITALATRLLGVPLSMISLIDGGRQWNKSRVGLDEQEVALGDSICRHVVDADAPLVVPDLSRDPRFADNRFVVDGARFYAGWPLHDGRGTPLGALCVLDESPRTLSEDQEQVLASLAAWAQAELNAEVLARALDDVRSAEQRMLNLLDQAPAAVLVVGRDGVVELGNAPALRLLGAPGATSLSGTPVSGLLPALELHELRAHGRRADDAGLAPGRRLVQRGRRGDGSAFPAELTVSVTAGSRPRSIVFVRDLAAEAPGEAELAELRHRTEVAFDALAEGVVVVEADGRLSFGNLAAAQLLRRRRTDLSGLAWHDVVHADDADDAGCELQDVLALAGRTVAPVEVRRVDGTAVNVELSVRMLHAAGTAPGVVVTLYDLTERLRAERLKDELVSAVSHELRTPLTSIRGSLSLLRAGVVPLDSEQGSRMVEIATASSERLSRLVDDILDLERLQAGRVELQLARHEASALMAAAVHAVSGAAVARSIRIDVLEGDERVLADHDRAVQVLVNLLGNALKFSPPGSTVTVSAQRDGSRVLLSVADQGRGIPADELPRIFDRFARVDGGDSREGGGTGLGLAIARGLAEQHGGSLSATSEVGVGSTFVLDLPAAPVP